MTSAATLLTETPIPTGKPAASGIGVSAWSSFASPFASLLAQGNFVQTPGMAPLGNGETPSPATLFATGRVGAALDGEDGAADPALNVIPLFDSTSLITPALVRPLPLPLPAPGLGATTPVQNGASSDAPTVAPTGDSFAASGLAPAAGRSANFIPTSPTDSPQTTPARTAPGQQDLGHGATDGHAVGTQPALKGVTAAEVMAEIAQLDPALADDAHQAVPATPAGIRQPAPSAHPFTTAAAASLKGDGQAAPEGEAPESRVISQIVQSAAPRPSSQEPAVAGRTAAKPTTGLGSALSGDVALAAMALETPDPRVTSQIVQSAAPRPSSEVRAVAGRAAAKPTTGLGSALSGDVALAAMAVETPKPSVNKTTPSGTPNTGRGGSDTPADPNSGATAVQPLVQPSSSVKPRLVTGQGTKPSVPPGLTLDPLSLGADVVGPPSAPRAALDARIDPVQPTAQPLRVGDATVQADRPTAMPAPTPPPAEQVTLQLRHAVAKGVDKISIQLSPASLGTVDVILEVTSGSRVAVQVIAERAETLDLLRADARGLERALQEAGLRTDPGSLSFNLRGDGNGASHQNSTAHNDLDDGAPAGDLEDDLDLDAETPDSPARQASNQALDIEV